MLKMKSKSTKSNNIVLEKYKSGFNFLRDSRKFVYYAIGIFLFFSFVGYFIPPPEAIAEKIFEIIEQILKETEGLNQWELTSYIFFNNLQSSFFGMVLGIFIGIFPIFSLMINGYLVGFVSSLSVSEAGFFSLWKLLPHGIFELPALFISLGLGMKIATFVFQKRKLESLRVYFKNSLTVFFLIVIPLLAIAAIIEGTLIYFLG